MAMAFLPYTLLLGTINANSLLYFHRNAATVATFGNTTITVLLVGEPLCCCQVAKPCSDPAQTSRMQCRFLQLSYDSLSYQKLPGQYTEGESRRAGQVPHTAALVTAAPALSGHDNHRVHICSVLVMTHELIPSHVQNASLPRHTHGRCFRGRNHRLPRHAHSGC